MNININYREQGKKSKLNEIIKEIKFKEVGKYPKEYPVTNAHVCCGRIELYQLDTKLDFLKIKCSGVSTK
jgi:hypothetical protein